MSPDELLSLASRIVGDAKQGEELEVAVSHGTSTTVRVFDGAVESFTAAESAGIGIRVLQDGREGFASAGSFDESVVRQTLADARDNATFAERDEFAGVAQPDGVEAVDIDLWRDELLATTTEAKIQYAIQLEAMVRSRDKRIKGVRSTAYGDSAGAFALASTSGITAATRATSASVSVHALGDDGDRTSSGYGFDGARHAGALDLDMVASRAVSRATDLIGAVKPATGSVALVFGPHETATILGLIAGTLSGDRIVKGRSPFVDRLGELVASPLLTLVDDATNPLSLGADSHDGEGLACRQTTLIKDGVLNAFLFDSYTGRKANMPSTGSAHRGTRGLPSPGLHAMEVVGQQGSLDDLIADVEDGVLVFSMKGLHSGVNPVSGDFSVGLDGIRIRNGVLSEPISECTAASTLQKILFSIRALGSDAKPLANGTIVPSMIVDDVMLSGDN